MLAWQVSELRRNEPKKHHFVVSVNVVIPDVSPEAAYDELFTALAFIYDEESIREFSIDYKGVVK